MEEPVISVKAASLELPEHPAGSVPWYPPGPYLGTVDEYDYVEEEWFATGG
jgi:hypothetical protein